MTRRAPEPARLSTDPCPAFPSVAIEMIAAPASAITRPPTATTTCQAGRLRRSSKISTPRVTETTGFDTDTVATEVARNPALSEICWSTNAAIPVAAIA